MTEKATREKRRGLKRTLFWLYNGTGKWPFTFRWMLLLLDLVSIVFFLWEPFHSWRGEINHGWAVKVFDIAIAFYITLDFAARFYIADKKLKFFRQIHNIADVFIVLTLIGQFVFDNLNFLRILRIIRIVRAFTFLSRAEDLSGFLNRHRRVIDRVTNFVVFLFIMSALVYENQARHPDSQIHSQLDALYFTVTSLTTTGYGDVLMQGEGGRVLAIVIMLLGLTLFVRMLQSIVSDDDKIDLKCRRCGLGRHDPDAVHCKRCGTLLRIQDDKKKSVAEPSTEGEQVLP